MAGKVYTVEFDEKIVSKGSKSTKVEAKASQKEVEVYGVVEINNKSSKCKVKNNRDAGFEKNVIGTSKKAVKTSLAKVDDYFDFSFRPEAKVETAKVEEKKVAIKKTTSKAKKAEEKVAATIKVQEETLQERQIKDEAVACERFTFDEEAKKIVSVARAGSLFG